MIRAIMKNQFIYSLVTKIATAFLGVLNMVFINRLLGPSLRGEYAYILNIVNLVTLVLNLGIYQSYPLYKRKNLPRLQEKFTNNVLLQMLIYIVFSILLCGVFNQDSRYIVIFTIIPFMVINKQVNFIVMVENINLRNRINIYTEFGYSLALLFVFLISWRNIYVVLSLIYLKSILQVVFVLILFNIKVSYKAIDLKLLLESVGIGFTSMISLLMITFNYKVDVLILKLFTDYRQIGLYSVGAVLAEQGWLISDAFKDVLFSKNARDDDIHSIKMCIKINVVITLLMFTGIAVFGKLMILLLFGKEFADAYMVTIILFSGILGMVFFKLVYPLFIATGKQRISLGLLTASAIVNIAFNFVLIPHFGIRGSAAASVISYNVCGFLFIGYFCREYKLNFIDTVLPGVEDFRLAWKKINETLYKKRPGLTNL